MTPTEIKAAALDFAAEIGERARVLTSISEPHDELPLRGSIYTNWPGSDVAVKVAATEWDELFEKLRAAWNEHYAEYCRRTTCRMALEIIRITSEQGECTDSALRGAFRFTPAEVSQFVDDACREADRMASNGPFTVTKIAGANAA